MDASGNKPVKMTIEQRGVIRQQRDEAAGITPARRAELDVAMKAHTKAVLDSRRAVIGSKIRKL